jgi:DNA-binding SARP family transcriptional activator
MSEIQLRLIGKPKLLVNGAEVEVKPRSVFELLAVIIASGEDGVSRACVANRLWGHLDKHNSRVQLRLGIHNLREELKSLNLYQLFNLDGDQLRFVGDGQVDLSTFSAQPPNTAKEIERLLLPIADGWDAEHWLAERDAFGEEVVRYFRLLMAEEIEDEELSRLLFKAVGIYPTTTRLYYLLLDLLEAQGRDVERNELVIAFEDRWADRFGTSDIPNLLEPRHQASNEVEGTSHLLSLIAWGGQGADCFD